MTTMKAIPMMTLGLLLAGCGGASSSSGSVEGSTGTVNLFFSTPTNFNGDVTAFNSWTTIDGSAAGGIIQLTIVNGDRTIEISAIGNDLKTGDVIDLAGTSGSSVVYADGSKQWGSTSGTITITARANNGVAMSLAGVTLTSSSGGATGDIAVAGSASFTGE